MAHVVPEVSPNCRRPGTVRIALDADVETPLSPTALPSAAATRVVLHAPEATAWEIKRSFAAQRTTSHTGWVLQIGAFDLEREAQGQLSSVHVKAGHVLDMPTPSLRW
jgi:hypothetical protein